MLGSNAEAGLLEESEADAIVEAARAEVPPGRVLIVGTGRESTRATIAACRRAAQRGADVVLVRAPSFFKSQMTPDALLAHYRAVADASPAPVMLYNVPGMAGFSLTVPTVTALAAHPNIIGMKETSNDLERHAQFAAIDPDTFAVLSGWAPVAYPAWVMGARGAIIAVANILPDVCVTLWDHAQAGRHGEARVLQQRLIPIAQLVSLAALAYKGGLPIDVVIALGQRILKMKNVQLVGSHEHHGRHHASTRYWVEQMKAYAAAIGQVCQALGGFQPQEIDIGGGFAIPRDPVTKATNYTEPLQYAALHGLSKVLRLFGAASRYKVMATIIDTLLTHPNKRLAPAVEDYAEACTRTLREELPKHGIDLRGLMLQLEPGRALHGTWPS